MVNGNRNLKNQQIRSKKSFTIENINGTSTVVVQTFKKSSVGNGQQSINWDGYSFYSQGYKPCGYWPIAWTKNFNYAVSMVTEKIAIPTDVNYYHEQDTIYPKVGVNGYGVDTYVPVAMSVWASLSSDSNRHNMVQAGLEVVPNKAPCIWYEHYYIGANCGSGPMTKH